MVPFTQNIALHFTSGGHLQFTKKFGQASDTPTPLVGGEYDPEATASAHDLLAFHREAPHYLTPYLVWVGYHNCMA